MCYIWSRLDSLPINEKKTRRRPTRARAGPALPSAKEPLTSVFGMGTGMTTPLWPPANSRSELDARVNRNAPRRDRYPASCEVQENKLSLSPD